MIYVQTITTIRQVFLCLMLILASPTFASTVSNQVTHAVSVSSSGDIFNHSTISWSPLSAYSSLNFSYVKLAIQSPSGAWQYQNLSGSSYAFKPNQTGNWCFTVRGWYDGAFGLFASSKCMTVNDSVSGDVTHSISVPSKGNIYNNSTISWSPLSVYSNINFSYVKLAIQSPSGSWQYQNVSGSSYTFKPNQAGNWCFTVRGWYSSEFGLFANTQCMIVDDSVTSEITHSMSVPSNGDIFSPSTVSWSPLSDFAGLSFSYVKLAIKPPNGAWQYQNFSGSNHSFTPDAVGTWCFSVRGWYNGAFGLYSSQQCMTVSDSIYGHTTHSTHVPPSGDIDQPLTISWSTLSAYSNINFSYIKLLIKKPDGSQQNMNLSGNSYNLTPDQEGQWCFNVRGKYDVLGLYGTDQCSQITNNNLLIAGDFENNQFSPWASHITFHVGNKEIVDVNGDKKLRFTTPVLSKQINNDAVGFEHFPNNDHPDVTPYDAFYQACSTNPSIAAVKSFRCIKSEISIHPSDTRYRNAFTEGSTTWFAYEFTVDKFFDVEDCKSGKYNKCYVFISQFHTSSEFPHLSPNMGLLLHYGDKFNSNDLELVINTKIDCDNPTLKNTASCSNPSKYCPNWDADTETCLVDYKNYKQIEIGRTSGISEGNTYYIRMKIDWSSQLNGSVVVDVKPKGGQFSTVASMSGIQTQPGSTSLTTQLGMYWGGLDHPVLFPKGELDLGMSITHDDIWKVKDPCSLPDVFKDQSITCN